MAYGLDTRACGWPCDPNQYVCHVSTQHKTRACLEQCEAHSLFTWVCDPCMFEKFLSFQNYHMLSV
ncbi:UvrABC system A [Gossypium arboreum]|uniref:UvrABC system A n=1 Tax=Gossypium arboreum TaxID=29729 RepID=A0A0B0NJY8_GOSAR|nr:UvrABC system A [Gossypium arboreum]